MKTIVVTGAGGVVGSAVLERSALNEDLKVTALTRKEITEKGSDAAADKTPNVTWRSTDYSQESLEEIFRGASAVIHLAGTKGDKTELEDFAGDLVMAGNILRAAEICGVRSMVYASSRLVYVNPDNIPWTEDTPPEPVTAYGINKVRIEELCRSWCDEHDMSITAVRIAQVLSEEDHMRNMVNVFRELAREGKELKVIGKSKARRQYIYAPDLADILLILAGIEDPGFRIVNAGMEGAYTNFEIAESFNRAYGNKTPVNYDDSKPETITPSIMDVSRMTALTGCVPREMDSALADMAERQKRSANA